MKDLIQWNLLPGFL